MRIALIGTRGVPARYGGFETAVEEIGKRLVGSGHDVTVYSRGAYRKFSHMGMKVISLPTLRLKSTDTLAHTTISILHIFTTRYDAAVVFNAANAPLAIPLKLKKLPYAVHVDGLEWKRLKWGPIGRRYYLWAERVATKTANGLIADAKGIQQYYLDNYDTSSVYIPYGAPQQSVAISNKLTALELTPNSYHLLVARFEPENYVDLSVAGFVSSNAKYPLVVVGSAPYGADYISEVHAAANGDSRVRFVGSIWDQDLLDQLYAHACSYIHGHSVGGTNPSLLRAMGLGALVFAYDVIFNREVLGPDGRFFSVASDLAQLVEWAEQQPEAAHGVAYSCQQRARTLFDWDTVAGRYELLCAQLQAVGSHGYVTEAQMDD
jgi:glycosyltransferase involved in cell wall biosynthesis